MSEETAWVIGILGGLVLVTLALFRLLFYLDARTARPPPRDTPPGLPVKAVMDMLTYHDQRLRVLEAELRAAYAHVDAIYSSLDAFQEGRGWAAGFRKNDPRRRPPPPAPIEGEGL